MLVCGRSPDHFIFPFCSPSMCCCMGSVWCQAWPWLLPFQTLLRRLELRSLAESMDRTFRQLRKGEERDESLLDGCRLTMSWTVA